jgi:tripeptide aminopeptidase
MADRLLETFLDLVRIDSPTRREADVAAYCARALSELGCEVRFDDTTDLTGSDTGNLIAMLPAVGSTRTLVLSAHMDCVEPCTGVEPVVSDDGVVTSAGETVLGADDKAGIAAILEALRRMTEEDRPHPAVLIILTVAEENGLLGAKALDPGVVNGDVCLVLDADGAPGGIVVGAPTHYTFVATFIGAASHAGVAPEEGRSAIAMASRAICAMPLGRLDAQTTANIGTISGGSATNVVPPTTTVTGECRSLNRDRVEQVHSAMDQVMREAARSGGGSVDIAWTREYDGFVTPEDSPVLALVMAACGDIDLEPSAFTTGGGSDGNVFAACGVPTVVLSCGMRAVHSTAERIAVSDLHALTDLLVAVAARLDGE